MRISSTSLLLLLAQCAKFVYSSPVSPADTLVRRAFSNSPTGGYEPGFVQCPRDGSPFLRSARDISEGEQQFLETRRKKTNVALADFLRRAGLQNFNVNGFLEERTPNIGIAFSGGGYRAMLSGAGALKAIDSRTKGTTDAGGVGGLLQSANYIAGLSGGSWLLGSVLVNNYTTIQDLQDSKKIWDFTNSILSPEGTGIRLLSNIPYYDELNDEVRSKDRNFNVSVTDFWGRALSRQFIDLDAGGPGVTWSSIALTQAYKDADFPFPIVVALGRNPGEVLLSTNATVYEFTPLELGSFDPQLFTFTKLEFIGTEVARGVPVNTSACVRGFDNAGFVMGTSSSLFNALILNLESSGLSGPLRELAEAALGTFSANEFDIANYDPNPFFGVRPDAFPSADDKDLTLVDGGEDLQNLPLHPLIQPARNLDVIFAFDNSADTLRSDGSTSNWPNGTALVASYARSLVPEIANGTEFPAVPDVNTFVNLGLNNRPTFFGCSASNFTNSQNPPPLLVYIPNSPFTFHSNFTTMDLDYSNEDRDSMIQNGMEIATQPTEEDWQVCVACAIIHRNTEQMGTQTEQCRQCMTKYCWDGSLQPNVPSPDYDPQFKLAGGKKSAASRSRTVTWVSVAAAVVVSAMMV